MNEPYDLIVIGGGINGAAIARDAALRGFKVVLLEKNDFGSGASTKTSKLAHGGIRYLAQFNFSLVKESLKERGLLLKNAPHLVSPLEFIMPVYIEDPRPLWQINLGLYFYDLFSKGDIPNHRKLNIKEVIAEFPGIRNQNLKGACSFYDGKMQDNRILMENLCSAESEGAHIRNYCEVVSLLKNGDKIIGVTYKNHFKDTFEDVYAETVVNATGVWSESISTLDTSIDYPRVLPTKGIHLLLPKFTSEKALLLHNPKDKRVFFVIPWGSLTLVGTTDTLYRGDNENVVVENDDVDYLLNSLNHFFPKHHFNKSMIVSSYAGVRPLVDFGFKSASSTPSDITRDHVVYESNGGMLTILGGKFTTHRKVAETIVDQFAKKTNKPLIKCETERKLYPGVFEDHQSACHMRELFKNAGLTNLQIEHILSIYGNLSLEILKILKENSIFKTSISESHPHIIAEIIYSIRFEHAKTVEDWLYRRTSFGVLQQLDDECLNKIEQIFANYLK